MKWIFGGISNIVGEEWQLLNRCNENKKGIKWNERADIKRNEKRIRSISIFTRKHSSVNNGFYRIYGPAKKRNIWMRTKNHRRNVEMRKTLCINSIVLEFSFIWTCFRALLHSLIILTFLAMNFKQFAVLSVINSFIQEIWLFFVFHLFYYLCRYCSSATHIM